MIMLFDKNFCSFTINTFRDQFRKFVLAPGYGMRESIRFETVFYFIYEKDREAMRLNTYQH